ncbi:MAG: NAD(P)-binding protein [Clostridia bacterium]|nr:NAD(P)-binding protein [Clostridia bacterium]
MKYNGSSAEKQRSEKIGIREAVIEGISVPVGTSLSDVLYKAEQKMKRSGFHTGSLHFRLYKKSVDARKKEDIRLVYSVLCCVKPGERPLSESALQRAGIKPHVPLSLSLEKGSEPLLHRPLVVGTGPAGLFCAYLLAKEGYRPLLIDRGDNVTDRVAAVDRFVQMGILDTESNIQFGAGGAGTFSDGKLLTRINDPRCAFVLETLRDMGAPEDVTLNAKPHVGTDVLRLVVSNLLDAITAMGGEVLFRCRLDGIKRLPDGSFAALTTRGEFPCGVVVLAPGHSARDTYAMLLKDGYTLIPKPMSVGVRIEHLRRDMDKMLYGDMAGHPDLGAAEYHLSHTKGVRGVYTFCMCPGGEVVAAASEEDTVVVNGMSHRARDMENSNSAVAVSVFPEDYEPVDGSDVLGAIEFQRNIEKAAFVAGGKQYDVPVMTVGDFLGGASEHQLKEPGRVRPSYRGGDHYRVASLACVLPPYVITSLDEGLRAFDKKLHGFAMPEAVLSGAETRTSAPVRILRGEDYCALGHPGIYPCGEGAGYAGGITSAAADGLRIAEAVIAKYKMPD